MVYIYYYLYIRDFVFIGLLAYEKNNKNIYRLIVFLAYEKIKKFILNKII